MFKRIIVATDLSEASDALIKCLGSLKDYGTEECLLVQCVSIQEAASLALAYDTQTPSRELREQSEQLKQFGYTVESKVVTGAAKQMLHKLAMEEECSIIVVGAQEHSLSQQIFFKGLAYEVIPHAKKPVLLIRLEKKENNGLACIESIGCDIGKHILFPTDFSENADHAFEYLQSMVASGVKRVTLLHVQSIAEMHPAQQDDLDDYNRIDLERLEELKKELQRNAAVEVDTVLAIGSPTEEILKLILEKQIPMVVIGSQGRGHVADMILGSVSHNVARHSAASVLLVPAK